MAGYDHRQNLGAGGGAGYHRSMIHFRCECGRTLSAEDGAAGETISCVGCGEERAVPSAAAGASGPTRSRPITGRHDFDAEIVVASRTAPPRPVRTPDPRPAVPAPDPDPDPAPPPEFDLLRVRVALRRLSPLAVAALVVAVAGAVVAVRLLPGGWLVRGAIALALLAAGVGAAAALVALREVGRTVLGLAERQRELTEIVDPRDEGVSSGR